MQKDNLSQAGRLKKHKHVEETEAGRRPKVD